MSSDLPAELRERADRIIASYLVSTIAMRRTKLRRAGREYSGICPFHQEKTASFYVNDAKQFYHCFGCGAHGDAIRFVMLTEGVNFIVAMDMIDGGALPVVSPEQMAKMSVADRVADAEKVRAAEGFWDAGVPVLQTPAEQYLWNRKIRLLPDTLRFGRVPAWQEETGRWGPPLPALLLRAEDLDGSFQGIQRIFITEDGYKSPMRAPKRSLGNVRGMSIRFGRVRPEAHVAGGPEDGLTLYQRFNEGVTVYVTCGEAMMPFLRLPKFTHSVTIARQNDGPALVSARKCIQTFREQGRKVRVISPKPGFKDWNDELRGIRTGNGK